MQYVDRHCMELVVAVVVVVHVAVVVVVVVVVHVVAGVLVLVVVVHVVVAVAADVQQCGQQPQNSRSGGGCSDIPAG